MKKIALFFAGIFLAGALLSSCAAGEKCPTFRNGKLKHSRR